MTKGNLNSGNEEHQKGKKKRFVIRIKTSGHLIQENRTFVMLHINLCLLTR